jgi:hypothetical protein
MRSSERADHPNYDGMTAPSSLPDRGNLADVPLPRILLELYGSRFTGRLELSRARTEKAFIVQDGALVGSESNVSSEHLSAILEDLGLITREGRDRVNAQVRHTGCKEGVALLSLELVDAKQLFEGLREQVRRRALECFGWADGAFALVPGEDHKEDVAPFRTDPFRLTQDGLEKHWSLDRMLESLGPRMHLYVIGGGRLGKVARRLTLDASVERMIAGLSGGQTLGAVIGATASSPASLAAFCVFDFAEVLTYSETRREADGTTPSAEIEIEITEGPASGAASGELAQRTTAPQAPTAPQALTPEAEKMRGEVLDRLENLDSMSFYELLGVEREAEHAAIRKAYFLAAKHYHPDAIARLGLQEIRTRAGEVFARIAEANEVLSNKDRRETYDHSLDGGLPEIDIAILAQAETFYRKGEILINMGDFRGALAYLKNAVELFPSEAAYQSDLAWAYYKKNPPEREPALEHIRLALERDPGDTVAQFRLGVIERSEA